MDKTDTILRDTVAKLDVHIANLKQVFTKSSDVDQTILAKNLEKVQQRREYLWQLIAMPW